MQVSVGSGQLYSHRAVVYCTFVLLFSVSWGCQHDLQYNGVAGQGVTHVCFRYIIYFRDPGIA